MLQNALKFIRFGCNQLELCFVWSLIQALLAVKPLLSGSCAGLLCSQAVVVVKLAFN